MAMRGAVRAVPRAQDSSGVAPSSAPPRMLLRPPLSPGGRRGERQLQIGTTLRHICNELGREPAALAWPCVQPIFGDCQLLPGFHSGCSPARAQLGSGETRGSTGGGGHGWGPPCSAGMSRCCWAGGGCTERGAPQRVAQLPAGGLLEMCSKCRCWCEIPPGRYLRKGLTPKRGSRAPAGSPAGGRGD